MRDAAQAGFDPTKDDRDSIFEIAFDQVCVEDHSPVGAADIQSAGSEVIRVTFSQRGRVIRHHRIYRATANPPEQLGLSQPPDINIAVYGWLRDDPDFVPMIDKELTDHSHTCVRRIDVGIPRDEDDIELIPSQV